MSTIDRFQGEHGFLSNFYYSPIRYEGINYPTVEHAFQAAKTHDRAERRTIAALGSPGAAKRAGRRLKLRRDWESVKVSVMRDLVRRKFSTHAELREQLLATGDARLVEGNHWNDCFWGVCGSAGRNWLGRILMEVRQELAVSETPQAADREHHADRPA